MAERKVFKFPGLLKKPNILIQSEKPKHDDALKVDYNNLRNKTLIGEGGFGKILSAIYLGNKVALKELIETDHEDIIKEARFLQKRNHKNIDFIGMDLDSKTLVLRNTCFDLSLFGIQKQVDSPDGLVKELGTTILPLEFTYMISTIYDSVNEGLRYLHRNNVAHRDLKPGNTLVSNQHIFKLQNSGKQQKLWNENPCEVKPTYFGEFWGKICQDTKVCKLYTTRVFADTVNSFFFNCTFQKSYLVIQINADLT